MESFTDLLNRIGRTDKQSTHGYGPHYDRWLAPYRCKPVCALEIGVTQFGGGSVLAFAEYFEFGKVWGMDIAADQLPDDVVQHERVTLLKADAYNPATVGHLPQFDIIVDDCYHDHAHQAQAFKLYWPLVNPGGMYVIEEAALPVSMAPSATCEVADNRATNLGTSVLMRMTRGVM